VDFNKMINLYAKKVGFDCVLKQTGSLNSFHDEKIQKLLIELYKHKETSIIASIFNAIYTQKLQTFLMSKKIAINLCKTDKLNMLKEPNATQYSSFFNAFIASGQFEILRKHTNNKAGVYKLIDSDYVPLLQASCGAQMLKAQEQFAIEYYDNYGKKDKNELLDSDFNPEDQSLEAKQKRRQKLKKSIEHMLDGEK
jgi:uncharacterized protein YqkB